MIESYRELIVWQRAMELVVAIYELSEKLPASERYGLVSQMQRAAVSIPSNIAEGRYRGTRKDFRQFLLVAYGSAAELETQLEIIKRLPFGRGIETGQVEKLLNETLRMLNRMIASLQREAKSDKQ